MEVLIRECEPQDLIKLVELYKHLHGEDDPIPAYPILHQVWQEIIDDPKIHCFIGDYGGMIVCSCILIIVPNLSRGSRPYGLIENVVTHSVYRRKGFGSSLLRYALKTAWKHNCYKVMLLTGRRDEGTMRFYEKAGFKRGIKQDLLLRQTLNFGGHS
jgi:GNAT superfamily N-acetyltransferase